MPRTKAFLTSLLLALLMVGCSPRPPAQPPFQDELAKVATWYLDAERFQQSAHGGMACSECHADLMPGSTAEPHPDADRLTVAATELYDYETCKLCHPRAYETSAMGAHAEGPVQAADSETEAPTCGHCHSAHYAKVETRTELLTSVSETCGIPCHVEALESYTDDYHGRAALLGHETTATCTDCHGAHNVLVLLDTEEAISACRRCHTDANVNLVEYRIHAHETLDVSPDDPRASNFRMFFWVKLFFTVLIVGVLGFFYMHSGLWFLRGMHEKLRRKGHD